MISLGPPNRSGVIYEPTVKINTSRQPVLIPGRESGRLTRKNVCIRFAPRSWAASSKCCSIFSIDAYRGRIMNGRKTWIRPMKTAFSVYRNRIGNSIRPSSDRKWLINPLVPSSKWDNQGQKQNFFAFVFCPGQKIGAGIPDEQTQRGHHHAIPETFCEYFKVKVLCDGPDIILHGERFLHYAV